MPRSDLHEEETQGGEGFLGRWSRRKQQAQRGTTEPPPEETAVASPEPSPVATVEDSGDGKELPLPSLEDVVPGGDLTAFLGRHVPDTLRNAALRKMWSTDPTISGFVEMADYQWDFTKPDLIPGWGSTVDHTHVEKMVGDLFRNWQEWTSPQSKIAGSDLPPASHDHPDDHAAGPALEAEAPDVSETSHARVAPALPEAATLPEIHKSHEESGDLTVSSTQRRRHGGALPA